MASIKSQLVLRDGMTPALRNITKALNMTLSSFESVQRASGKAVNTASINAARAEIGRANVALDKVEQNLRDCGNEQDKFNKKLSSGTSHASSLMGKIKGIAATYIGMQTIKAGIELSDELTSTQARLKLIVDDEGSVDELQKKIYASAQSARASYTDTMATVAKLGLVAGKAFEDASGKVNTDKLVRFTELVNKNFVVGGASATEQSSAMYQLTQALGSGRLQGDEYRSIIENAPLLAKSIEDYMRNVQGVDGTMKEWAADGLLTAEVIKAAVFRSADEVEERFNQMPMTWAQVWTSMKNKAIVALDPVLSKINELANNPKVQNTLNTILGNIVGLVNALLWVFDVASAVYNFFAENWGWIAPIFYAIAAAVIAYNVALLINNAIQGISTALKTAAAIAAVAHETATIAEAAATTGMTTAQVAFNAALYACPLTWILLLIIAIIAIIFIVIGVINKVTGSSISAIGVIVGSLAVAAATIWNIIVGVINAIIQFVWTYFVEPWIGIIEFVLNVFNGGFNSFGDAVKNLLGNIISWFLSLGKVVTKIIDAIFGTNWTAGLSSLQDKVLQWGKNENAITLSREAPTLQSMTGGKVDRWAYSDAWSSGYSAGENIENSVKGMLNFNALTAGADIPNYEGALGDISDDTGSIAGSVKSTDEDLSYLRDLAEMEAINRFTTAEVKIDMTGMTNKIDSNMDLDGVLTVLTDGFAEALEIAAEGVHS